MGLAWWPLVLEKKCELTTPPTILGQGIHLCRWKSKFHLRPLRKSTKMGLAWCPLVLEKNCKLMTPHNFGSRNSSVSTEIKISPLAIKKKHQHGSSLVSRNPSVSTEIKISPSAIRSSIKMGLAWCPLVLEKKCELTTPPLFFGQRIHLCWQKSKFHLLPLWKSTKMGLAWCLSVLEKKCELTTPHNFGSRNPSVSTEFKISPSAIMKKNQNGSSLLSVGPRAKMRINDPPQFWVKESICVDRNQNFTFGHYEKAPKWV